MLEGALRERADATLKAFSEEEQELCRRIFLRLTQPGERTEDTKRRTSMQGLLSLSTKSTAEEDIIQKLADASLLTTEGDVGSQGCLCRGSARGSDPKLAEVAPVDRCGQSRLAHAD